MREKLYSDDIPEVVFRDQLSSWRNVSKYQESGSIYTYHKGIVLRRHQALVIRPDLVKSIFDNQLPILIDLELSHFEDNDAIEAEFQKYEQANNNPTYWICGIDKLLLGKSVALFHYLRKRQAIHPSVSYVLFFSVDFLHPSVRDILTYTSTFLQNTCISPLYSQETGQYFLKFLSIKWKFQLTDPLQQQILKQTARHFSPLKQSARFIRDTTSDSIDAVLHHEMMSIKLKSIFGGFLPSEQSALAKVVAGANDFSQDEISSLEFLKKTEWLESRGNRLQITIPLLANYIDSLHSPAKKIEIAGDRILLGEVPINAVFSEQEQSVFRVLIINNGHTVTRDDIAKSIWGDRSYEKYSDWAIDQIISRLRKKCTELDMPKSTIMVVKGKGFRYG